MPVRPDLAPPDVVCPDDLAGKVGASTRCYIEYPEGRLGVTVTVTYFDDGDYEINVKADTDVNQ